MLHYNIFTFMEMTIGKVEFVDGLRVVCTNNAMSVFLEEVERPVDLSKPK